MHWETAQAMPPVESPSVGLRIQVTDGPDQGAWVDVQGPVLIGTSEVCDLQLSDRTVSRRHLAVEPSAVGVLLRDQDSSNGTWLDQMRLAEAELPVGSAIRLGETHLRIEAAEERADPTVPQQASSEQHGFGRFLGSATALQPIYTRLERSADSDVTVLIEGESGTGKELLAEGLHERSSRSEGPFVVVDCGAVPENLLESELFGHERGAFTGATNARSGAFEQAHGGSVFLDEIGELPLQLQTRLLRVIDQRKVRRIGSNQWIDVDVRVIAATNRNLDREVEEGRFRLDLFHRLAVVLVRVPPLYERPADIDALARHFVQSYGGDESVLTDQVRDRMRRHRWPGNVRELRNYVERLVLFGTDTTDQLPTGEQQPQQSEGVDGVYEAAVSGLPYRQARAKALDAFAAAYVEDMLRRHSGNVSQAARAAGIARRHLQRLKQR